MSKKKMIGVQEVEVPEGLYPRASRPGEKDVEHLRGCAEAFPPIVVAQLLEAPDPAQPDLFELTGATIVVDGVHRLTAAALDGVAELPYEDLGQMTGPEILAEAIKRNATHGKQLSMRDKERLANLYAADGYKVGDIVKLLAVGERTVSRWVAETKEAEKLKAWKKAEKLIAKGASISAAAKEVGVPRTTLKGWTENPPEPAPKKPAPKQEKLQIDTTLAKEAVKGRVAAIAEMIEEFAKDSSREASNAVGDGEEYPAWYEISEVAIAAIRARYPKDVEVS